MGMYTLSAGIRTMSSIKSPGEDRTKGKLTLFSGVGVDMNLGIFRDESVARGHV